MGESSSRGEPVVDTPLFMFAAGFSFGVGMTLVLLAVVGSALGSGTVSLSGIVGSEFAGPLLGGAVFAIVLGSGLFLLAYRRNRRAIESAVGLESE